MPEHNADMPELIAPDERVKNSFLEAMAEFEVERGTDSATDSWIGRWSPRWSDDATFALFLADLQEQRLEEAARPVNYVPTSTYWWVDDDGTYLGRVSIRHRLNDHLLEVGGHIGYDVRPSARRRGHAGRMLVAALAKADALGIDPVLITCDTDNVGSIKVIEAAGGVLEDVRGTKRRYWVSSH